MTTKGKHQNQIVLNAKFIIQGKIDQKLRKHGNSSNYKFCTKNKTNSAKDNFKGEYSTKTFRNLLAKPKKKE